ncbi:regucalcin-like [Neodiprion fabricii]|uniref:regucalcin-like n=1 Tax=Neodiprion fabricii TaxID=2872261 RepID=UPI001ED915EC|nr:regucalcin-like [Neodiprion fabricii]
MAPNIKIVHNEKLVLGEGPYWDHVAQVLYYVNVLESTIFKYEPSTEKFTQVIVDKEKKSSVSFVIPVEGIKDKFVIGYGNKLALLTWNGISTYPTNLEILISLNEATDTVFNDGKVDPRGRLWTGTVFPGVITGSQERRGELYRMNSQEKCVTSHATGIGISNGLAWSTDHKIFYYIDSLNNTVDAFDYNINSGELSNRRIAFDFVKNNLKGFPDGMTIDVENKLWVAAFNGSAVHQVDPETGSLLQSVKFPTSQITSATWGGPNLDELYVTSASHSETGQNFYAGRLFKVTGLGTSGLPGFSVKLQIQRA